MSCSDLNNLIKHEWDACAKIAFFHSKAFMAGRQPQMTPAWTWVALALVAANIRKHMHDLLHVLRLQFHHRNSLSCFRFKWDLRKRWNLPDRYIILKHISLKYIKAESWSMDRAFCKKKSGMRAEGTSSMKFIVFENSGMSKIWDHFYGEALPQLESLTLGSKKGETGEHKYCSLYRYKYTISR